MFYNIAMSPIVSPAGMMFKIKFGDSASNDKIVAEVAETVKKITEGGGVALVDGPASLPVAFVLCHKICHLFEAVAVKDPKMGGFIITISHTEKFKPGDIIPAADVK